MVLSLALLVGIVRIGASFRDGGEISGIKQTVLSAICLTLVGSFGLLLGAFA